MDISGPQLFFPEWLRVGERAKQSGESGVQIFSKHRNALLSKKSGGRKTDHNTPRNSASTDEEFSTNSETSSSCNGIKRHHNNYNRASTVCLRAYSGFCQNPSFNRYEEVEPDRDVQLHDGKISQEREREQNVVGRVENDRGRDCKQFGISHRGSCSGAQRRFEEKKFLKNQNGTAKSGGQLPLPNACFVSNLNKAAFEREFPSLGAEKKHASLNLNQGNIWQGQVGRSDSGRPSLSGLSIPVGLSQGTLGSGVSAAGANGQVSSLVDIPNSTIGLSRNGISTVAQKIAHGSSVSFMVPGPVSAGGDNMVDTSAQNPPQICATLELNGVTQNREELSLKQSRQLVPVTRSLSKSMVSWPSEKLKPKLHKHAQIETISSSAKFQQPKGSFYQNSSVRSPGKLEFKKPTQGEIPFQRGNFGSNSFYVSNTGDLRIKKFLVKNKAGSSSSIADSTGLEVQSKDKSLAFDEKKTLSQNRSEFFNDLRKKASATLLIATETQDQSTLSTGQKMDELSGKSLLGNKYLNDVKRNGSPVECLDKYKKAVSIAEEINEQNSTANCSILENIDKSGCPVPMNGMSFISWSEEEEIAFMRSLGWDENAEEQPLTEEEINAFYKKNETVLNALLQGNRWQGNHQFHLRNIKILFGYINGSIRDDIH